ncbi:hypothetical protein RHS01_09394 [Rhizoctonia solani]|uniref:Transposase Tc1-like domain-containing protein n=1 Tax=Rhizoctonia solani TaxID=456999 RepID=A0A8H7I609_9AGAM|nr:hypothetical protein RHS01_09394 [Rhizoctonia solani]
MAQYTSPKTKAQIIALKKLEYSDRAIVQLLQPQTEVSHATVGRIWAKYGLTDRPLDRHNPIPGRPRKLTPSNVRFAALALAWSRVPTAANIRRQYFPAVGPLPSAATSESWFTAVQNAAEYPCSLIGIEKPIARGPQSIILATITLDNIVFLDKVRIKLFGANSGQYYWRQPTRPRSKAYSQADTTLARQLGHKRPPMAVKSPDLNIIENVWWH